ncbi:ribokinase [Litchfieldia alkalitelluris]|uniref:ribokinase n=1 Tax=Litchfieldia alkalitelluris TaxID=304268 RepID=UPI0009969B5F|nr:ribokinase [Litchfieldia alkalitelluris]
MTHSNRILVIGSYNMDLSFHVTRLPKPGETLIGKSFHKGPGGKGSNQAIAAARLGGEVSFMGCIGDDLFGKEALEMFAVENIDTDYLLVNPEQNTGIASIVVDESAENQIIVTPGANYYLLPEDIENKVDFQEFSWLVIQLEVPFPTVKRAIELAKQSGTKIILNPAPYMEESIEILPFVDLFIPNETEAELVSGVSISNMDDVEHAAKIILEKGAKQVVITLGSRGVYMASTAENQFYGEHLVAQKVKAIDTTGAGDCFVGALAVALSEDKTLRESVRFAISAAGLSVQRMGAGTGMPYREELN